MISYAKLFLLGCIISFMAFLYSFAFEKGYEKHKREVESAATEIVIGSHTDILVAAQNVKEKEKDIKNDEVCSTIWNFDLRECLHK